MVLSAIFNNISIISWVSFIGGGKRRKLTNFITYCCIEYTSPSTEFELKTLVVILTLIAQVVVNSTTVRSRPPRHLCLLLILFSENTWSIGIKHRHLFLVKKYIPRYYIYHKVRNRSFVKNLGHRDFRVFSTRRTPAWRNGLTSSETTIIYLQNDV